MKSDCNGYPCSHIIARYSSICDDFPVSLMEGILHSHIVRMKEILIEIHQNHLRQLLKQIS